MELESAWRAAVERVTQSLVDTGRGIWPGVGTFEVVVQTGEPMPVAARRLVRFWVDPALKAALEGPTPDEERDFATALYLRSVIELSGFGALEVKNYPGYQGRNPSTGAVVMVKAKRGAFWVPSPELNMRVAQAPVAGEVGHGPA